MITKFTWNFQLYIYRVRRDHEPTITIAVHVPVFIDHGPVMITHRSKLIIVHMQTVFFIFFHRLVILIKLNYLIIKLKVFVSVLSVKVVTNNFQMFGNSDDVQD